MTSSAPSAVPWIDRPLAELLRLSAPVTVSMLSYSAMTLVDTYFVAQLGAEQLAGVGLGGTVAFTLISFGFGLVRGGKTLVSQAMGAGRRGEAGAYLGAALAWGLAFGVLAVLLQWPLAVLLQHFAATPAQGEYFRTYLFIRSLGSPSAMIFSALREVRYGLGDSTSPMRATLVANMVNVFLAWLFVRRLGLGVAGAAWATVIAQTIEALVLALYQHLAGWGISATRRAHLVAALKVGIPAGLQMLLEIGAFALLSAMIASLNPAQMAAHQITLQIISFSFLPAFAVGESASVLVGQVVGAGREDQVLPLTRLAIRVVGLYTSICTVLFLLGSAPLIRLFTSDEATQAVAKHLVYASAVFLVIDGVNIVARSTLRGVGDVRFPAWVGILCSWCLTPPLTWLLGLHLGLGALGGWIGISGEIFLGAAIQWARLLRGGWRPHAAKMRAQVLATAATGLEA